LVDGWIGDAGQHHDFLQPIWVGAESAFQADRLPHDVDGAGRVITANALTAAARRHDDGIAHRDRNPNPVSPAAASIGRGRACVALDKVSDAFGQFATFQIAAPAQFQRDVFRHVPRPLLCGIESDDADRVCVTAMLVSPFRLTISIKPSNWLSAQNAMRAAPRTASVRQCTGAFLLSARS
jgi:hypothetical protein